MKTLDNFRRVRLTLICEQNSPITQETNMRNQLTAETVTNLKTLANLLPSIRDFQALSPDQLKVLHDFLSAACSGVEDVLGVVEPEFDEFEEDMLDTLDLQN